MSAAQSIVIVGAARTPVGAFNGAFANVPAHELGAAAIGGALARAGVDAAEVDEVILGQILQAGEDPQATWFPLYARGIAKERSGQFDSARPASSAVNGKPSMEKTCSRAPCGRWRRHRVSRAAMFRPVPKPNSATVKDCRRSQASGRPQPARKTARLSASPSSREK